MRSKLAKATERALVQEGSWTARAAEIIPEVGTVCAGPAWVRGVAEGARL